MPNKFSAAEILDTNVKFFKLMHPAPAFNEMCAEEKTLKKLLNALLKDIPVRPFIGRELWGLKIYVDEDVPKGKVRFKCRGVTVDEVYAFNEGESPNEQSIKEK